MTDPKKPKEQRDKLQIAVDMALRAGYTHVRRGRGEIQPLIDVPTIYGGSFVTYERLRQIIHIHQSPRYDEVILTLLRSDKDDS